MLSLQKETKVINCCGQNSTSMIVDCFVGSPQALAGMMMEDFKAIGEWRDQMPLLRVIPHYSNLLSRVPLSLTAKSEEYGYKYQRSFEMVYPLSPIPVPNS
jgi:hypothetical protein